MTETNFLEQIRKDFLEETSYLLDQCEESYLKLEKPEHREAELANIFRLAHSIKGAGSAVGFTDLAEFAHVVEDCLSILRVHPNRITSEIISLLLKSGDAFKVRVDMLKQDSDGPWDVSQLKFELKAATLALSQPAGTQAPSMPSNPAQVIPFPEPKAEPKTQVDPVVAAAPAPSTPKPTVDVASEKVAPPQERRANDRPEQAGGASSNKSQNSSVKVDTDRIESVLDLVGELVVIKSQLINETSTYNNNLKLNSIVSLLDKTIRELQDKALGMRMTPLKPLFLKAQRIARDLSIKLEKQVEFLMSGEDTEIDRNMVELVADPLMHIIRNSLDHGIERPETRRQKGKPEKGTVSVSARQVGGRVILKIEDDGGGINRDRVLKKGIERNLIPAGRSPESLSDSEVFNLIFAPGFSTAEQITDVSGRGVGMDVVKTNIEKLRGTIDISSNPERGTCMTVSIPLTTSITDGMLIVIQGRSYVIPMDSIRELGEVQPGAITRVSTHQEVLSVRGQLIPILPVNQIFASIPAAANHVEREGFNRTGNMIVVVEVNGKQFVLRIQGVIGQTQVVLKALGESFENIQGIAGAAILGDGKVSLVLDLDGLAKVAYRGFSGEVQMESAA